MFLEQLSKIVQDLLVLVAPAIVALVGGLLFKFYQEKKANAGQGQQWLIATIVTNAVNAAEQLFGSNQGQAKLDYAVRVVEEWLGKYGIKIERELLVSLIEAAVFTELNKYKPVPEESG